MEDLISRHTAIEALGERPVVWNEWADEYSLGQRNQYDADRLAIETAPTIDAIYGFKLDELALIATLMQKEGIEPKEVLTVLQDARRLVQMIVKEQSDILKRKVEEWSKNTGLC